MAKNKSHSSKAIHRRFKPLKTLIFSRIFIVCLLLIIQATFFAVPLYFFYPYMKYVIQFGFAISLLFSFYLVNSPGKNEFKIAWLIPVLIMPVFGILLYLFFKLNRGGSKLSKNLSKIKNFSLPFLADINSQKKALSSYPKVEDISSYLKNNGGFYTFTDTATKYFSSTEEVFPVILESLKKAEKFIFVEYFVIEESFMWDQILSILVEKAVHGIQVYVLYDSLGSVSIATRKYQRYLNSLGLHAKVFSPFIPIYDTGLNNRDHRKLINIDGITAFTGGFNISDEYINLKHQRFNYWKDAGIMIEGPAVRTFTTTFLQLWYLQNKKTDLQYSDFSPFVNIGTNIKEENGAIIPYCDDAYSGADIAEDVYNYIISRSHNYIHIMTPYFVIDNTMMNALVFAAKRGVQVQLIVPEKFDHLLTFSVGRRFIRQLINNGVQVFTFNNGFIHSKVFISDDKRATVGSINLDYRSLYHHFECGTFLYKSSTIADIEKDFQQTLEKSTRLTMKEYKKIPLVIKLTGWIFKVFAPLL